METKKCNKCLSEFPLSRDFFWRKRGSFTTVCIPCSKEKNKLRYSQNQERYLQQKKDYSSKNKEAIKERNQNQYLKNKEKRLEYQKNYARKNKEILRPKIAARAIKKYHSDIFYKIKSNLSIRMRKFFKKNGSRTVDFIGCSIDELKCHLESKFQDGMNWDNYGLHGWHVDHIRPCTSFDLSKKEEQEKCFHYTNLQPLWAIDNIKKSNKWGPPILSSGEVL
jgi:hypothetical protein